MILGWIVVVAFLAGIARSLWASLGSLEPALPSLGAMAVVLVARRARRAHYRPLAVLAGMAEGVVLPFGIFLLPIVFCALGALARATRHPLPARHAPERFLVGAVAYPVFLGLEQGVFTALGHPLPPVFGEPLWMGLGATALAGVFLVLAESALDSSPRLKRGIERVR